MRFVIENSPTNHGSIISTCHMPFFNYRHSVPRWPQKYGAFRTICQKKKNNFPVSCFGATNINRVPLLVWWRVFCHLGKQKNTTTKTSVITTFLIGNHKVLSINYETFTSGVVSSAPRFAFVEFLMSWDSPVCKLQSPPAAPRCTMCAAIHHHHHRRLIIMIT